MLSQTLLSITERRKFINSYPQVVETNEGFWIYTDPNEHQLLLRERNMLQIAICSTPVWNFLHGIRVNSVLKQKMQKNYTLYQKHPRLHKVKRSIITVHENQH